MKIVPILTACVLSITFLSAQNSDTLDIDQLQMPASMYPVPQEETVNSEIKKTDVDLSVGTSFTVSPNNYYAPSIYVAPSLSYKATPKLTLTGGVFIEQANLYPMQGMYQDTFLPMTRAFLYARGAYQVNQRLRVNTTVFKGIQKVEGVHNEYASAQRNIEAMEFGFDYKFSNSFSIGIQMRVQNRDYPYYENPFSPYPGSSFYSPYW